MEPEEIKIPKPALQYETNNQDLDGADDAALKSCEERLQSDQKIQNYSIKKH
jgi:hypothetical protein